MKIKRTFFQRLAIIVCLLLSAGISFAGDKGQVTGQVKDVWNDINLMGVAVSTPDGRFKTTTDASGEYRINLPQGSHSLTFKYIGFEPVTKSIQVTTGETDRLDINFGESFNALEELVVQGSMVGQAKALNRQKSSLNLKNIVASDAFGRFPDQNAAEALDRLPGISIARDQGEGRFVIVRGINPHLNSASVDNVAMAAPDADTRAVLLDVLPMNVMETLVVTKALTPDMPGDSIGGHINIETPSAYDKSKRTLMGNLGGNYSELTEEWAESAQMTYGDVFGANRQFGLLLSASFDKRDLGSDNVEADPWEQNDNGIWITDSLEYREYDLTRERMGLTANLEFKPNNNHNFFLRGLYGDYEDHEYRRRAVIGDMAMEPDAGGNTGMIVHEDEGIYPETAIQMKDRTETQMNYALSFGGENVVDNWTIDYMAAYSYAEQDTPEDREFTFVTEDLSYRYSGAYGDTPKLTAQTGDINDLGIYEFDEVEDENQIVEEEARIYGVNFKKELDTSNPAYIKGGFLFSSRNKKSDVELYVNDDAPGDFDTLAGNTGGGRNEFSDFPLIDEGLTGRFESNRQAFAMEYEVVDSLAEDYETDEDITGMYIMGNVSFDDVDVLAGIRMEYTDLEAKGYIIDEDLDNPVVGAARLEHDYSNVMPGIHVKMDIIDDVVFHAAWTNSISRPLWEQTRYAQVTDEDDNIEIGNPELDPYESINLDATLSYYLPDMVGMASIGLFYKDIDNFIYSQTSDMGDYELTTWNNGKHGHILGMELAYQQALSFLPAPFDGFSFLTNLTFSSSNAEVPETGGEPARDIDFVGHSDTVGSIALSYEKSGFFARLSGSYRSEYLDSLGEEPLEDEYIDDHFQVDLSTAYTFMEKYTVYANLINITNEPLKAYYGESGRLRQFEEYGWSARVGIKFAM